MRGPSPDTTPSCQSCGYSLAGLDLHDLHCPGCGVRYCQFDSVSQEPRLLDPVARPHLVCLVNTGLCVIIAPLGRGGSRYQPDWAAGAMAALVANIVMLMILSFLFPRRTSFAGLVIAFGVSVLALMWASIWSVRIL